MNRKAKCSCGELEIELSGDPIFVVTCSCLNCQRRTGSVFGVSAYFDNSQVVNKNGKPTVFSDISDTKLKIERSFCASCGSTVYWEAEFKPNMIGVAVGCFEDPKFPEPKLSAWNRSKHEWVSFPSHWLSSQTEDFKKRT